MNKSVSRKGFSLIEVLVVTGIIAVLIGLLIPAIQSLRNAAKKAINQNNIKQMLLAMHSYASDHNGVMTPTGDWPGVNACGTGTIIGDPSTYTTYTYRCGVGSSIESMDYVNINGNWVGTVHESNRADWTSGPTHFLLLPYLGYDNNYHQCYGPMQGGSKTVGPMFDPSGCGCIQWVDVGPTWKHLPKRCARYQCPNGVVPYWGVIDHLVASKSSTGYMSGRYASVVKTYIAAGDLSVDLPNYIAPVSFPIIASNVVLDGDASSFKTMITERYAGCNWGSLSGYGTSGYANTPDGKAFGGPFDFSNTDVHVEAYSTDSYSSWSLTGDGNDGTVWPPPLGRTAPTVQMGIGLGAEVAELLWTGNVSDTPGPRNLDPSLYARATYIQQNYTGSSWTPASCDAHPDDPTCTYCASNPTDFNCHPNEWFIVISSLVQNHQYFADHPSLNDYCNSESGMPTSMIPGSLNLGMMDGSVRSVTTNVSLTAWQALMSGREPNGDLDNW